MISGDRIPWNAITICEMTKTSWQMGNLKMNEDLANPSGTCFVRGWNLGRKIFWLPKLKNWKKLEASEIYPRRLNAKEVLITQRDGSAKLSVRDYEFQEPTLKRESTVTEETVSGESHGNREEFRPGWWEMTQKIGNNFGLFKDTSLIAIKLNQEFNFRAERRIIPYFQDFFYWTKLLREENVRCGGEDWRKAKP